jgi:hypothetical protein
MASDGSFQDVLDRLAAPAQKHEPDWPDVVRRAAVREEKPARPSRRRALAAALAATAALGMGVAIAATTDILQGTPAPPENDAALRQLFPPLSIGPATELTSHDGRTLFGARTKRGGYCFSATSPIDPKGEGGHCVSDAESRALDRRHVVSFAMSGSSVGGYAAGADHVRVTGAGIDVELPVSDRGWWVGTAPLEFPPLPASVDRATVVATAYTADGTVIGRDPLLRIRRVGKAYSIAFV